jgi:hypothetical protein
MRNAAAYGRGSLMVQWARLVLGLEDQRELFDDAA